MRTILYICTLCLFTPKEGIKRLEWDDFKGKIPAFETKVAARTVTQLMLDTNQDGNVFSFECHAELVPEESFIRLMTKEVLDHENTHWQIALLCSKECNKAISRYQGSSASKLVKVQSIYKHYVTEIDRLNKLFDKETNHGLNVVTEGLWEKNIEKTLIKKE